MTLLAKALLGTGVVASASTVAIVSTTSFGNNGSSSTIVEANKDNLSPVSQGLSREDTNPASDSQTSPTVKDVAERSVVTQSPEASSSSHTSSVGTASSRVPAESEKIQVSSNEEAVSAIEKSALPKKTSSPKSDLEKQRDRALNDDLCREVAKWTYGDAFLRICREDADSSNMEFEYFDTKHTSPIKIENLRFHMSNIVITLERENQYGEKVVRMELSQEMLSTTGLFSSFGEGKPFAHNSCTLNNPDAQNKDWKIKC